MDSIPERILWLIRQVGTTQAGMARDTGVGTKAINSWIKRGIMPRESNLREIADTYGIPRGPLVRFILEGGAPPKIEHGEPINGSGATLLSVDERRKRRLIPHVGTLGKAALNWNTGRQSLQVEDYNADAHVHNPTPYEDAFSFEVEGDSMVPVFRNGDRLIAAPSAEPFSGCYCIVYDGDDGKILIRQVEFEEDGAVVRLVPANRSKYEDRRFRIDDGDQTRPRLVRIVARWEPL